MDEGDRSTNRPDWEQIAALLDELKSAPVRGRPRPRPQPPAAPTPARSAEVTESEISETLSALDALRASPSSPVEGEPDPSLPDGQALPRSAQDREAPTAVMDFLGTVFRPPPTPDDSAPPPPPIEAGEAPPPLPEPKPQVEIAPRAELRGHIGRLSISEFFALVNWRNDPKARNAVHEALATNPDTPDREANSVGSIMAEFGWDDE